MNDKNISKCISRLNVYSDITFRSKTMEVVSISNYSTEKMLKTSPKIKSHYNKDDLILNSCYVRFLMYLILLDITLYFKTFLNKIHFTVNQYNVERKCLYDNFVIYFDMKRRCIVMFFFLKLIKNKSNINGYVPKRWFNHLNVV